MNTFTSGMQARKDRCTSTLQIKSGMVLKSKVTKVIFFGHSARLFIIFPLDVCPCGLKSAKL